MTAFLVVLRDRNTKALHHHAVLADRVSGAISKVLSDGFELVSVS